VVVVIKTQPAIQIFFKRQILDEWVAWQVGRGPIEKKIGNSPVHWLAQNCEKFRWPIENSSDVHGNVLADRATNRALPFNWQLMEHLGNCSRGSHPKRCEILTRQTYAIEVLIWKAVLDNGPHR
jgi:hypothetical protein